MPPECSAGSTGKKGSPDLEHKVTAHKREEQAAKQRSGGGVLEPPKGWLGSQMCRLLDNENNCYENS